MSCARLSKTRVLMRWMWSIPYPSSPTATVTRPTSSVGMLTVCSPSLRLSHGRLRSWLMLCRGLMIAWRLLRLSACLRCRRTLVMRMGRGTYAMACMCQQPCVHGIQTYIMSRWTLRGTANRALCQRSCFSTSLTVLVDSRALIRR